MKKEPALYVLKVSKPGTIGNVLQLQFTDQSLAYDARYKLEAQGYNVEDDRWGAKIFKTLENTLASVDLYFR